MDMLTYMVPNVRFVHGGELYDIECNNEYNKMCDYSRVICFGYEDDL